MRYPCNLFGQPASSWIFWSKAMPVSLHAHYPLVHTWAEERARAAKSDADNHRTGAFMEPRVRRLERRG